MVEIKEEDYKKVKKYLEAYVELLEVDIEKLHDENLGLKEKVEKAGLMITDKVYAQELLERI